jgi:hypothetical protein
MAKRCINVHERYQSLRQLIPNDHVLVRVDRVLDLSWLRGEVQFILLLVPEHAAPPPIANHSFQRPHDTALPRSVGEELRDALRIIPYKRPR